MALHTQNIYLPGDSVGVSKFPTASYQLMVGVPESPVALTTVQVKEKDWLACDGWDLDGVMLMNRSSGSAT